MPVHDPLLWKVSIPSKFLKSERQLFLMLRIYGNGVLSKCEKDQIKILRKHDVTYLKLLGAVKTAQKRVTDLQKDFNYCSINGVSINYEIEISLYSKIMHN